jgi:hypothetical protein
LQAIDKCWANKEPQIRPAERKDAAAAYEKAREVYRKVLSESTTE